MTGHILALDQGTTGTTALIFDRALNVAGRAASEFAQHYPHPGWVEHDPEEIWRVTLRVAAKALAAAQLGPAEIAAVGLANQRETVVLWERRTLAPIGRAIVWQDRRTAAACDALRAEGREALVRARTGLTLDPYFSASKIRWMLDRHPGLRARAERGEIAFGTVDSWLLARLTAGRVHATDVSNAARTLLFDIHALRWDPDLLALFGIPAAMLPEVLPSSHRYGETDPEVFGARVPIAGVAGDQQAALFGEACHREGMAKNTYGTGSFVMMHTGTRAAPDPGGLLSTVAWKIGEEPAEYALEGAIFVTGAAIQWLRDGLGLVASAAETEALAASLRDNGGVYFVPALAGLGAPHWDPYARGLIVGLTRGSGRAHLVRAALEGMCQQTRDVVETMEQVSGVRLGALRADGGASANGWLMQFQADMLGVPVEVPPLAETTALGAAFLAGLAVGFWESRAALAAAWRPARRYLPQMAPAERDRLRRCWARALERSRGWARDEDEAVEETALKEIGA